MDHTIVALVEDKPGVLNRVASLFRRRNFNIKSLNVGNSETPNVSRMTLVVDESVDASKIEANLYKLVNVVDVQDVTNQPAVVRELAMISIFRGNIVDVAPASVTVELTGSEEKVEGLVELLRPRGIIEMVRTGKIAMMRGDKSGKRYFPETN